eukprot:COSAG04_NODE_305_length_17292_cov_72.482173_3_plen_106_part_00
MSKNVPAEYHDLEPKSAIAAVTLLPTRRSAACVVAGAPPAAASAPSGPGRAGVVLHPELQNRVRLLPEAQPQTYPLPTLSGNRGPLVSGQKPSTQPPTRSYEELA